MEGTELDRGVTGTLELFGEPYQSKSGGPLIFDWVI